MQRYVNLGFIGEGSYGVVLKAKNKQTGEIVAVKRIKEKIYSFEECMKLREVNVSRKLRSQPHIVSLKEAIRQNNELYLIFEFMDANLYDLIKNRKTPLPNDQVKVFMRQILLGLQFMHSVGLIHRDMKPENVLVTGDTVKIADLGLVRELLLNPPYTDYVATRWYRAPEILLRQEIYGPPVDIWATGCIMVELLTLQPLFPGANEMDQLNRVLECFPVPLKKQWPYGHHLALKYSIQYRNGSGKTNLHKKIQLLPPEAAELLTLMLHIDPKKRISATDALKHRYFADMGILEVPGKQRVTTKNAPSPQSVPAQDMKTMLVSSPTHGNRELETTLQLPRVNISSPTAGKVSGGKTKFAPLFGGANALPAIKFGIEKLKILPTAKQSEEYTVSRKDAPQNKHPSHLNYSSSGQHPNSKPRLQKSHISAY